MVCWRKEMKLPFKIWILIIALVFSFIAIFGLPPTFLQKGVLITSVEANSTAFEQGFRQNQIITHFEGKKISSIEEFNSVVFSKFSSGEKFHVVFTTSDSEIDYFSDKVPKIIISEIPKTNIKLGLDLAGGARALVRAENKSLDSEEVRVLVDITSNRLNEFGLSDIKVSPITDLSGENFMLIEIAGATPNDLEEMLAKQGKFEARIGNKTVFEGGSRDVASVSRNAQTSGVEQCGPIEGGSYCRFRFAVYLSENAAKRHAEITNELEIDSTNPGYLSEKLDLYLDDILVDSLLIGEGLKGQSTTQIVISGSGEGINEQEAFIAAEESMHKLQTVLVTGSLPYKLEIAKLDIISPILGDEFMQSILLAGGVALLAVAIIIFIRYKKFKSSLALLVTSLSEIVIILGIASLIEWNLDLPSIAGILATMGTGIDQQIIVMDEARQGKHLSVKERMKRAFSIILGAYFTAVVAMLPLLWAGAGLLKGFAVTTIIGITVGVLITRPAFTEMIKRIGEK
jgi:preprotein translocase subunit SecD